MVHISCILSRTLTRRRASFGEQLLSLLAFYEGGIEASVVVDSIIKKIFYVSQETEEII